MKIICTAMSLILVAQVAQGGTSAGDSGGTSTPTGPSVNQNANDSAKSNNSGANMSTIMGAGLTFAGVRALAAHQYPKGALLIGMGILSVKQGREHGSSSGSAMDTAGSTNGGSGRATEVKDMLKAGSDSKFGSFDKNVAALKKGIGGIKADFNKGTVSLNGKTYPASDFASAASMQAAGFNPDQIGQAMAIAVAAEKKIASKMGAATATNGFNEGGGGGSAVTYVEDYASDGVAGAGIRSGAGLNLAERDPAQVAGMSKDFNGEPIGVAADSIFEMMNRRYILKDKQNAFINETDLLLRQK